MGKLLSRLTANGMRKWKNTLKVDISWQIREKFSELEAIEKEMQIKIWCFYLSAYSEEAINITVNSGIFITTWLERLEKLAQPWRYQSLQLWTKPQSFVSVLRNEFVFWCVFSLPPTFCILLKWAMSWFSIATLFGIIKDNDKEPMVFSHPEAHYWIDKCRSRQATSLSTAQVIK